MGHPKTRLERECWADKVDCVTKEKLLKEIKNAKREAYREIKELIQEYRLFYTVEFMDEFNKKIEENK